MKQNNIETGGANTSEKIKLTEGKIAQVRFKIF